MVLLAGLATYWNTYFRDNKALKRSRTGCRDELKRPRDAANSKSKIQLISQENLVSQNEVRNDCRIIDFCQEIIERKVGDCMKKMKAMEQKMVNMNKRIEKCEKPE